MDQQSEDGLRSEANTAETADGGRRIILNFPSLDQAAQLMHPWRDSVSRARAISNLHEALLTAGLNLEIRVAGRPVAELGANSMRGALLTLLRLHPTVAKHPLPVGR